MIMKTIVRISAILSVIVAMSFEVAMARSSQADSSYFPLRLGAEWTFSSGSYLYLERIADTATIRGKFYFGLTLGGTNPVYWYRSSNDSVFVIKAGTGSDSSESLLYNFSAKAGDTIGLPPIYGCSFGVQLTLQGNQETVTTSAGTFTHCYHFRHFAPCADAGMQESWFAKGVGRIKYTTESFGGLLTYTLVSYSMVTAVTQMQPDVSANSYALFDFSQKPFNPQTTFSFHVGKSGFVSLKIVDLFGRQIANLVNDRKRPGDYQIVWNSALWPSGVYCAVFRANNYSAIKKLSIRK
jgi:hypothetical protein